MDRFIVERIALIVTAGNDFINRYNATINANSFNVAVEEDFSNQSHIMGMNLMSQQPIFTIISEY